jgi:prepilin-type N-terminal cleavage/methylation domain-containing protein
MLRKNRQGFTLVELMVVIVIIGVLAALAIPRFGEASTRARLAEGPRVLAAYETGQQVALSEEGYFIGVSNLVPSISISGRWWHGVASPAATGTGTMSAVLTMTATNLGALNGKDAVVTIISNGTVTRTADTDLRTERAFANWGNW